MTRKARRRQAPWRRRDRILRYRRICRQLIHGSSHVNVSDILWASQDVAPWRVWLEATIERTRTITGAVHDKNALLAKGSEGDRNG